LTESAAPTTPEPPAGSTGPEAIFVVGVSRSGTTLMRNVLNGHSRIAIAPENHYLGHLLPGAGYRHTFRRHGDLADDETIQGIVAQVYSREFQQDNRVRPVSPYWRWVKRNVRRRDLERRLLAAPRTERGQFDAFLRAYADAKGASVIGEKTPAHVAFADTLLDWFPGGRVVHMIRDPRGVYVSELRRRLETPSAIPYRWLVHVPSLFRAFVLLQTAWAWAGAVRWHRRLRRRYPDAYRLVRFGDLVRHPEPTIRDLCTFLDVPFETAMLDQQVTSRGVALGSSGFDAGAADRWRASISDREAGWLARLLGRRIEEMGYDRDWRRPHTLP
jgi:hypothetical protein